MLKFSINKSQAGLSIVAKRIVLLPVVWMLGILFCVLPATPALGQESEAAIGSTPVVTIWSGLPPQETELSQGVELSREEEWASTFTRIAKISSPTLELHLANEPNGTAILVLPGGGFQFVVPDLEGSELAPILNPLGTHVFVLRYRVEKDKSDDAWRKPTQDSQRAIRWIRHQASRYHIQPDRIGIVGFSAGGQVAAWHIAQEQSLYEATDEIDSHSFRPNFAAFIYPWQLLDRSDPKKGLRMNVSDRFPKSFLVATSDDPSADPRGSVQLYQQLLENEVDAELHIFRNGKHGFGTRPVADSNVDSWPQLLSEWMKSHGLVAH